MSSLLFIFMVKHGCSNGFFGKPNGWSDAGLVSLTKIK